MQNIVVINLQTLKNSKLFSLQSFWTVFHIATTRQRNPVLNMLAWKINYTQRHQPRIFWRCFSMRIINWNWIPDFIHTWRSPKPATILHSLCILRKPSIYNDPHRAEVIYRSFERLNQRNRWSSEPQFGNKTYFKNGFAKPYRTAIAKIHNCFNAQCTLRDGFQK